MWFVVCSFHVVHLHPYHPSKNQNEPPQITGAVRFQIDIASLDSNKFYEAGVRTLGTDLLSILGEFESDFLDALQFASQILNESGITAAQKADLKTGLAGMVNIKAATLKFKRPGAILAAALSSTSSSFLGEQETTLGRGHAHVVHDVTVSLL